MRMLDFGRIHHYQMQGTGVMNSGYGGAKSARKIQAPPGAPPNKSSAVPGTSGIMPGKKKRKPGPRPLTAQGALSANLLRSTSVNNTVSTVGTK